MTARRSLDPGHPVPRLTRVRVIGPRRVKGMARGEEGEILLTADQAEVLVAAGHIELLPDDPPEPAPPLPMDAPEEDPLPVGVLAEEDPPPEAAPAKKTTKPRRSAGLSAAQDPADAADQKKE
ncbi:hypothetical protein [Nocardiopsis sp. NPDC057823]|uniref:hypothetical protein n=1 Tax=Nocardiopsis sp. NPDC057823 TaxID=3346256 RepID=UPI00366AB5DC